LRVIVKAEARKFGDAKLLAKDALGIIALKNPSSRRDSLRRHLRGAMSSPFRRVAVAGEAKFPWAQQLEFVAQSSSAPLPENSVA